MRRILLVLVLLFSVVCVYSQESVESFDYIEIQDSTVYRRDESLKPMKKIDFGMDVGMAYMFSSSGYGGPMFSLSPHVSYPLNKRFSVSAGMSFGYGNFYNPYLQHQGENSMMPMTQMFVYASGNYHVSERLMVSGSVYKQFNDVPNPDPDQPKSNYDGQGVSLGFQYKLTPHISFGAEIRVEQPGIYSPYTNPYNTMGSPNWW